MLARMLRGTRDILFFLETLMKRWVMLMEGVVVVIVRMD